jgi:hypothetical protein
MVLLCFSATKAKYFISQISDRGLRILCHLLRQRRVDNNVVLIIKVSSTPTCTVQGRIRAKVPVPWPNDNSAIRHSMSVQAEVVWDAFVTSVRRKWCLISSTLTYLHERSPPAEEVLANVSHVTINISFSSTYLHLDNVTAMMCT